MKLVPNAKHAYKWFSMWCMAASMTAPTVWLTIPQEMRDAVPATWLAICAIVLGAVGMIGRMVHQGVSDE